MPDVYGCPQFDALKGYTYYQACVGPETAFSGQRVSLSHILLHTGGPESTMLVVEAGHSVPWTCPLDVMISKNTPLPPLGGPRGGRFNALFANGKVSTIADANETDIRSWMTVPWIWTAPKKIPCFWAE
jgi:hypothetical protein